MLRSRYFLGGTGMFSTVYANLPFYSRIGRSFPLVTGHLSAGPSGYQVRMVTNLAASGAGSLGGILAELGTGTTPTLIVFAVSGDIVVGGQLVLSASNVTIQGWGGPGLGVCLRGWGLDVRAPASNVLVTGLRSRPGIPGGLGNPQAVHGFFARGLSATDRVSRVIFDRCSVSWHTDEGIAFLWADDCAAIGCFVGPCCLVSAASPPSWAGKSAIFAADVNRFVCAANVMVDNFARTPLVNGSDCQVVGNVVYNWGSANGIFGLAGTANSVDFVANWYGYGPGTEKLWFVSVPVPGYLAQVKADCHNYFAGNKFWKAGVGELVDGNLVTGEGQALTSTSSVLSAGVARLPAPVVSERLVRLALRRAGASWMRDSYDDFLAGRVFRRAQDQTLYYGAAPSIHLAYIEQPEDDGGWPSLAGYDETISSSVRPSVFVGGRFLA